MERCYAYSIVATKKQTATLKRHIARTKKRASLAFIPKKENQYRPHLIRRYSLLVLMAIVIGLQFGYNFTKTGSILGQIVTITPAGLLAETNDRRTEASLPPLTLNPQLSQAAQEKADDMLAHQYWSHTSPSGVEPWTWIDDSGYSYEEAGENLAKNFTTASATVSGWMASEGHRENILKASYQDVGFAVASGELDGSPTTIVVALYAKPVRSTSSFIASASTIAPTESSTALSPAARIGIAIQSLTPAAITSIALLFIAATVATTAHAYRSKLPKRMQKTWYKKHGAIKASGLLAIAAFIVLLYGGGQI